MVEETELETLIDAATLCPLPPLPIPDHATRFRQWSVGCGVVLCAIVIILSTTWALMYMQAVPSRLAMALVLVVSGEAVIALICLVGLHGDSDSVILRDPSQPMPDDVVSALRIAGPLPSRNIEDEQRGSFCVRCLVWRPVSTPQCCAKRSRHLLAGLCEHSGHGAHHCSICQRCVAEFSHHCGMHTVCCVYVDMYCTYELHAAGFFGRCIAGRGRRAVPILAEFNQGPARHASSGGIKWRAA